MLKKIRRMLTLQVLTLGAAMWFWRKKREAIERSVRAARAAWNAPSGDQQDDVVVAVVLTESEGGSALEGTAEPVIGAAPNEPAAARPGY